MPPQQPPSSDQPAPAPIPTERFQRVLAFASDEADGLGHGFVTCQHILYALTRENKGLASAVLNSLNVTPDAIHDLLAESSAEHDHIPQSQLDLADEVRDAIERAVLIAREWKHRVLDTEHLLYGVLSVATSADELLRTLRVDPHDVLTRLGEIQNTAPAPAIREEATHAYRFSLESAWLLSQASDIARQQGGHQVAAIHLLSALVALPGPVQDILYGDYAVGLDDLLPHIPQGAVTGQGGARLPLAQDIQRVLGHAIGEAWNRGHQAVTPLHLAMGLAVGDRNAALDTLAELGVSQAEFEAALERIMPPPVR